MATALTHAHPLLHAFRASKPAFGIWLTLPGALNARAAASASPHLSWVVVDCEHGMTALHPGAGESVNAIAGLGPDAPSTIVRIPATGACADGSASWQIKYVLDQGARGVLVPMVSPSYLALSVTGDGEGAGRPEKAALRGQRPDVCSREVGVGLKSRASGIDRLGGTLPPNGRAWFREPVHSARVGPRGVRGRLPPARERVRDGACPDRDAGWVLEPRRDPVRRWPWSVFLAACGYM